LDITGLVSLNEIEAAAQRIAPAVARTPLIAPPPSKNGRHAGRLLLKPENLQPVGSFKLRGAFSAISALPPAVREKGVVAYSSGNHAQGVAYAASRLGIPSWIVIDEAAPAVKIDATRSMGAQVVTAATDDRQPLAHAIAERQQATLIPPYDHPDVIAGQGTIGLEIMADCPDLATVVLPVSGGGLASGVAAAIKYSAPRVKVVIVEPELAADTIESLHRGRLVRWPTAHRRRTIAEGLVGQPSALTFAHLARFVDDAITVSEAQILDTIRWLALEAKLVAEPSGAVATAAYLHNQERIGCGTTVAILSGGNITPVCLQEVLQRPSV
jgi:threonine dehydratase